MPETLERNASPPQRSTARRPAGRPKNSEITEAARNATPFPEAPRSTIKGGAISPEQFFPYVASLTEEHRNRAMFYVYRQQPVIDASRNLTAEDREQIRLKKKNAPIKYIEKTTWIDPSAWKNQILRAHGSGDYTVSLNDSGVRGNAAIENGPVCRCFIQIRDDEFPPVIPDLSILVMEEPANQAFINNLRLKGIVLPGDKPKEEGDAVAIATTVEKLTDTVIEMTKNNASSNATGKAEAGVTGVLQTVLSTDRQRHIEEMRQMSDRETRLEERHREEMRVIREQMDRIEREAKERALAAEREARERVEAAERTAKERQAEPLKGIESLAGVLKSLMPAPAAPAQENAMLPILMNMFQASEKRAEAAEARNAALMEKLLTPAATPPPPPPTEMSTLQTVFKMFDKLNEFREGGAPAGPTNQWVALAEELGPSLLQTIQSVAYNISAMSSAGAIKPAPPASLPGEQQQVEQQQQTQETEEQKQMNLMRTYSRQIYGPLVQALEGREPGWKLGGRIAAQFGPVAYQAIAQGGKQGVYEMLYSDAEVKGGLLKYGQRLDTFIDEFLMAPNVMAEAQQIQAMGVMTQPPPPPQQPVQPSEVKMPERQPEQPASGTRFVIDPSTGKKVQVAAPSPVIIDTQATA